MYGILFGVLSAAILFKNLFSDMYCTYQKTCHSHKTKTLYFYVEGELCKEIHNTVKECFKIEFGRYDLNPVWESYAYDYKLDISNLLYRFIESDLDSRWNNTPNKEKIGRQIEFLKRNSKEHDISSKQYSYQIMSTFKDSEFGKNCVEY